MYIFAIMYASQNIANMSRTPDTLMLMSVFGICNLLTSFIYDLIIKKAKHLAPYILIIIPIAYIIGLFSMNLTGIMSMQSSEWNGKYMMVVYLIISGLIGINYFIERRKETN